MSPAQQRSSQELVLPSVLLLLALPLICWRLASYGMVNGDEAIYHAVSATMVESGDWFRLDFRGEHRLWDTVMNAPVQYWARALLITIFGENLWTARILSALCGVASVLMTYRLVRHLSTPPAAFLAGLCQLSTLQFVYLHSARTGELETALTLAMTAAAYLFIRAIETGRGFFAHHLCLALILNLKLPTVAVPLLAELACFALIPTARAQLRSWLKSAAWMMPLALSWHATQMVLLWEPFWAVVAKMGAKAAGETPLLTRLASNSQYYLSTLLFGAFPHALAYPVAIIGLLVGRNRDEASWRWNVLALFILALWVFYLPLAERNRWYVVPAYPFLSAFLGAWIYQFTRSAPSPLGVAGVAALCAMIVGVDLDLADFNPFAEQANRILMQMHWSGAISPFLLIPGLAALAAIGFRFVSQRWAPAFGNVLIALLLACTVGFGTLRVIAPLRFLGHQTDMARIRSEIDLARASRTPIALPIDVAEPLGGRASYYFAKDFRLVPVRSRRPLPKPIYFQLHPKPEQER